MLSYKSYAWKCVLGAEIAYGLCLAVAFLPFRTAKGFAVHSWLFETIPGFTWINPWSVIWGALVIAVLAFIFGLYIVWMHNSSMSK